MGVPGHKINTIIQQFFQGLWYKYIPFLFKHDCVPPASTRKVFCFLSSLPLLTLATKAVFGSFLTSLFCTLNWHCIAGACLIIWWERFRGTQKEDERGPLSFNPLWPAYSFYKSFPLPPSSEAQFIVRDWGNKVDYCIEFSYRPVRLHRLAGWCDNPMP